MNARVFILLPMGIASVAFCFFACQRDVPYDDIGNDNGGSETPVKDISEEQQSGFQNKTIKSLGETGIGWSGVDILLVVDNSPSIIGAQTSFATETYAMVNAFLHPLEGRPAVKNIRLAVATTDMGLQWGTMGEFDPNTLGGCAGLGDNGAFAQEVYSKVGLEDKRIPCDDKDADCPDGWSCQAGVCAASQSPIVTCNFSPKRGWIETTVAEPDPHFAQKAACLAIRGDSGCSVEQQLASMRRTLDNHPDFLNPNHVLLVVVLTDNDDCSIENPALFGSDTWGTLGAAACHNPEFNNDNLFDVSVFYDALVQFKKGNSAAVFFAAVAGTPQGSVCTGDGNSLDANGCLFDPKMQYTVEQSQLVTACTQGNVTAAAPGRRLVEVAQMFGVNGYVESICDSNFSMLTRSVTARIQDTVENGQCLLSDSLETEAVPSVCATCAQSKCELYVEIVRTGDDVFDTSCPKALVFGVDYGEKAAFKQTWEGDTPILTRVFCPVQKSAVPLDCQAGKPYLDETHAAWSYCERPVIQEETEYACIDGIDNDGNGAFDCSESSCGRCMMCGAVEGACELGCKFDIVLTSPARVAAEGNNLFLECPYR